MANTAEMDKKEIALGAKEVLLNTLRPHPLSFIRYYSVGILLLLWVVFAYWLDYQWGLEYEPLGEDVNLLLPALFLALGAALIGTGLVSEFNRGFRYLWWIAILALLVVSGLFIWLWEKPKMVLWFAFLYSIVMGVLGIGFAEAYRRAFKYMVTNQRVVIRYKLLDLEETNMRFEKIEDFEIVRPLWFRIMGLGIIRPYTGTEDAKYDANRNLEFHGPKEALYGIRRPNEVKRQLIEIILERDQWDKQMVELLEDQKAGKEKPAPAPRPAPSVVPVAAAVEPAAAPQPPETPQVAYYQPSPPSEPEPVTVRNYERIDTSDYEEPDGDEEMLPPPSDDEEQPKAKPSPVRTMYPEVHDTESPFEMEDTRTMDFERGDRPRSSPGVDRDAQEEEGWRERDPKKPRSL